MKPTTRAERIKQLERYLAPYYDLEDFTPKIRHLTPYQELVDELRTLRAIPPDAPDPTLYTDE